MLARKCPFWRRKGNWPETNTHQILQMITMWISWYDFMIFGSNLQLTCVVPCNMYLSEFDLIMSLSSYPYILFETYCLRILLHTLKYGLRAMYVCFLWIRYDMFDLEFSIIVIYEKGEIRRRSYIKIILTSIACFDILPKTKISGPTGNRCYYNVTCTL